MRDYLLNVCNIFLSSLMIQNITDVLFLFLLVLQVVVLTVTIVKTIKTKDNLSIKDIDNINQEIEKLKGVIKDERINKDEN